jgi:hypothetical protein
MPVRRGLIAVVALLTLAACGKDAKQTYVEMATAAMLGDIDGFLEGFSEESKKLVRAQITLSEAYGMEDLNPYELLVFNTVEEIAEFDKGAVPGKSYVCKKPCAVLKLNNTGKGARKRQAQLLMLEEEAGWRVDTRELELFWTQEGQR